jgi:hypothetical protein
LLLHSGFVGDGETKLLAEKVCRLDSPGDIIGASQWFGAPRRGGSAREGLTLPVRRRQYRNAEILIPKIRLLNIKLTSLHSILAIARKPATLRRSLDTFLTSTTWKSSSERGSSKI